MVPTLAEHSGAIVEREPVTGFWVFWCEARERRIVYLMAIEDQVFLLYCLYSQHMKSLLTSF